MHGIKTCGLAGITHWLNSLVKSDSDAFDKHDPLIVKLKEEIDRIYESGRTTAMSDDEMRELIRKIEPEVLNMLVK